MPAREKCDAGQFDLSLYSKACVVEPQAYYFCFFFVGGVQ